MSSARGIAVAVAVTLSLGSAGGAAGLDHFKVYQVKKVKAPFKLGLLDQLSIAFKKAEIKALTHFANPAAKQHAGGEAKIEDRNAHLTWYSLSQSQAEPRRTVRFRNQFGQSSVDIREPRVLLVPAQKTSDPGSEFPKALDHYKCYRVVKLNTVPPPPVVTLSDQFVPKQQVQVGKPVLFCTPVRKQRQEEKPPDLFNAKDHLTVYALPPKALSVKIKTRDQFGERSLAVVRGVMLAVPTEKQVAVPHQS